ncbi:hypothetical protein [Sphingobacterium sp. IITKGP-BTPF85]|uniref:hypothetical protein n=1 Tax=Sphingobacterium sp. IITKGP-BTPF85 TaxID=1338009 RepID=UPI000419FCE8|nr:hypothetical protein [Sphingobacterium sp. IITKGP-BTPF85]
MEKQKTRASINEIKNGRAKNRKRQNQYTIMAYSMSPVIAGTKSILREIRPSIIVMATKPT